MIKNGENPTPGGNNDRPALFLNFLSWRERHIKERSFILILSFFVGLFTACAALLLKWLIHLIHTGLESTMTDTGHHYMYLIYPALGILITSLFVKYIVKDDIKHGVTKILFAISQRKGRLKVHHMWTSMVASSITIGTGGSLGAEAPIVLTGSSIGSNIGRLFRMSHSTLMVLIGCGAASAIAGIFKAPIAGMLFTIEVLMLDLTTANVLPLLIASVTAATVSYFATGHEALFPFVMADPFTLERIPWVIVLGIGCGVISLYMIRGMMYMEGWYKQIKNSGLRILIGSAVLGLLIFLFPPLFGEGYDVISDLINRDAQHIFNNSLFERFQGQFAPFIIYSLFILFFKVVASASTNGSGGVGGVFAPSLFLGCFTGFITASLINTCQLGSVSPENFALMGMAGVMSGVMHAPLTGIFLVAELTGGYQLFLPLMIVSGVAYLTILVFEKYSIYSMRLARKGELLTHNKDQAVLTLMKVDQVIETDFETVDTDMSMGSLIKVISHAQRNVFPVVSQDGRLVGQIQLNDIRNIMFRTDLYDRFKVGKLMVSPPATILDTDSMEHVMKVFDETRAWQLPVTKADGTYLGFVSRSRVFQVYRNILVNFSAE